MHPDVRVANAALDLYLRTGCCGERELRVSRVHPGRCSANECVRNCVRTRIAALQTSHSVVRMSRWRVVLMRRKAVVVLRVIVLAVGVRVQQRGETGRRNQRRDEQQRQDAVHASSL